MALTKKEKFLLLHGARIGCEVGYSMKGKSDDDFEDEIAVWMSENHGAMAQSAEQAFNVQENGEETVDAEE